MENRLHVEKVVDIVEKVPLAEVLDTMEGVAMFVPGAGNVVAVIIKILRILTKMQPAAVKSMHGIADMRNADKDMRYKSFIPAGDNPELEKLRTMVDLALEDGEISDEEKSILLRKIESMGMDPDIFIMGLNNELNKITNNQ